MEYKIEIKGKKEELKIDGKFNDKQNMLDLLLDMILKVRKGDFD